MTATANGAVAATRQATRSSRDGGARACTSCRDSGATISATRGRTRRVLRPPVCRRHPLGDELVPRPGALGGALRRRCATPKRRRQKHDARVQAYNATMPKRGQDQAGSGNVQAYDAGARPPNEKVRYVRAWLGDKFSAVEELGKMLNAIADACEDVGDSNGVRPRSSARVRGWGPQSTACARPCRARSASRGVVLLDAFAHDGRRDQKQAQAWVEELDTTELAGDKPVDPTAGRPAVGGFIEDPARRGRNGAASTTSSTASCWTRCSWASNSACAWSSTTAQSASAPAAAAAGRGRRPPPRTQTRWRTWTPAVMAATGWPCARASSPTDSWTWWSFSSKKDHAAQPDQLRRACSPSAKRGVLLNALPAWPPPRLLTPLSRSSGDIRRLHASHAAIVTFTREHASLCVGGNCRSRPPACAARRRARACTRALPAAGARGVPRPSILYNVARRADALSSDAPRAPTTVGSGASPRWASPRASVLRSAGRLARCSAR